VLTAAVGVPRMAEIEYPFGVTLGRPGDAAGQMAVLRAALEALAALQTPGESVALPFVWNDEPKIKTHPPRTPPIARYLFRHPWHYPAFLQRKIPGG
jgi:hypothetical protein